VLQRLVRVVVLIPMRLGSIALLKGSRHLVQFGAGGRSGLARLLGASAAFSGFFLLSKNATGWADENVSDPLLLAILQCAHLAAPLERRAPSAEGSDLSGEEGRALDPPVSSDGGSLEVTQRLGG